MTVFICKACDHFASDHRLEAGGGLTPSLYACRVAGCTCSMNRDSSVREVSAGAFFRGDLDHIPRAEIL